MSTDPVPRPSVLGNRDELHAVVQPWFVGSGTRLMTAVLVVVALLVVVRIGSTIWLMQQAWTWGVTRLNERARAVPVPPPIASFKSAAAPAIRTISSRYFGAEAYPAAALRRGQQGLTTVALSVDQAGRPSDCRVRSTSGSGVLDRAACRLLVERIRFNPPRRRLDPKGNTAVLLSVRWELPAD